MDDPDLIVRSVVGNPLKPLDAQEPPKEPGAQGLRQTIPVGNPPTGAEGSRFYLLACRICGDGSDASPIPFGTARERERYATEHTQGTGHDRWWVWDESR